MTKQVTTVDGDTVDGLLNQYLGDYSDATEQAFYKLNPGVAKLGPVFSSGVEIVIPDPVLQTQQKRFTVWD